MIRKRTFYTEAAYLAGIFLIALGTAFFVRADFGMSMVVAPAYLIHLKVSQFLPFFSFGMSEYIFQLLLLCLLSAVMRRFRKVYLLSFITAVLYGLCLDAVTAIVGIIPGDGTVPRVIFFILGLPTVALGVAFMFRTYLMPEAYELIVKEISARFDFPVGRTKTVYDVCSCLLAVALSFAFFGFGEFVGIGWGTLVCTLLNGVTIGAFDRLLGARFEFPDFFTWRARMGLKD